MDLFFTVSGLTALYNITWWRTDSLYIVAGFGRDWISTFKPHCFKVIRKTHLYKLPLFVHKIIYVEQRSSEYISVHRPSTTSPQSNYFTIYLCINLAVFLISLYRLALSICRLSAFLCLDLSVCQGDPSSAASLFLSICLNRSLFWGTWA